jgi:tetratricopeptide (TPR) repeat protein
VGKEALTPAGFLAARRSDRLVRAGNERHGMCDLPGSEQLYRRALAEAELSRQPARVAHATQFLYFLLRRQGRYEEAVAVLERKVEAHRRRDGPDGKWTAEWRNELIMLYGRQEHRERLEALCRERLESDARRYGARSLEAAWAVLTLAWALRLQRRWDEGEALCSQALDLLEAACGKDHPSTGWAHGGLALIHQGRGDLGRAEAALRRARENWERAGHTGRVAAVDELLIELDLAQGRYEDALELSSRCLAHAQRQPHIDDDRQADQLRRHAAVLRALGREAEARDYDRQARRLDEAIDARRRELEAASESREPDTPQACSSGACIAGALFPSPLL